MKAIIISIVLFFFCISLASSTIPKIRSHPLIKAPEKMFALNPIAGATPYSGLSAACSGAMAIMASNTSFSVAAATYSSVCSAYGKAQVENSITHITSGTTDLDIEVDCTKSSNAAYSSYQTLCTELNGKWCTTSFSLDVEEAGDEIDLDAKMYACLASNCSKTDINTLESDLNTICTTQVGGYGTGVKCSFDISCGSSAVIIIIIIIVIIVVLVVIAVVVVMVMRKRRAEYTPIKTGEYH